MNLTVKQIETALRKNGGFVSRAAKSLNVTPQAIYLRMSRTLSIKKVFDEIQEKYLDLAESKLLGLINDGNLGAICFYLKCKGKKRGYIEALQLKGDSDSKPQPIKIEIIAENGRKTQDKD